MFPTKLVVMSICALLILYITDSSFSWQIIFLLSGMFAAHLSRVKLTEDEDSKEVVTALCKGAILAGMICITANLSEHENLVQLIVFYVAGLFVGRIEDVKEFLHNAFGKKKD